MAPMVRILVVVVGLWSATFGYDKGELIDVNREKMETLFVNRLL